jgi:hypothetical protein
MQHYNLKHQSQILFWLYLSLLVHKNQGILPILKANLLTGIDRPSTGRVEPVRGCLNNPSRLEWTTLTSLTAPLAALRSFKKTKERIDLS